MTVEAPRQKRLDAMGILLLAVVACVITCTLAWVIPAPADKPIGDAYRADNGAHMGEVLKIDPKHQFPNGMVDEGWLVRKDGIEMWWPRSKNTKLELVRR